MIYMDIETTGFDGTKFEIIEIYMLKEDADGNKIDEMHYFFKPTKTSYFIVTEITTMPAD